MRNRYSVGDWVVYRKSKQSTSPGPRAQGVVASTKGEKYSYVVDKYWVVEDVLPTDELLLRTRRGKVHRVSVDDLNLRHAGLLARLLYRHRFREAIRPNDLSGAASVS